MIKRVYKKLINQFPRYRTHLEALKYVYQWCFADMTRLTLEEKLQPLLKEETRGAVLEVAAQHLSYKPYITFDTYKTLDINAGPTVDYVMDLHHITLSPDMFNTVVMTEVLEHLYAPAEAAQQIHKIIRPGGKVIATTRFVFPYHGEPYDFFRFTEYGLREIFKDYTDVRIVTHGNLFLIIWELITYYRLLRFLRILNRPLCFLTNSRGNSIKNPLGFIIIATK